MRISSSPDFLPFVVVAALAACAAPRTRPDARASRAPSPRFGFHSGFWVNLHQRLFAETNPPPIAPLAAQDGEPTFTPDERARWNAALDAYRTRFPQRTVLTSLEPPLSDLERGLAAQPDARTLNATGLDPSLATTLASVADVYRGYGWAADDRSNRAWIAALEPRVALLGAAFVQRLATAYAIRWPTASLHVEVAVRAGTVGAFTFGEPALTTIASGLPRYQGDASLEMLFHEASHAVAETRVETTIERACAASGRPVPGMLWHAVLFYTAAETARQLMPGYTPYAYANHLYERSPGWDGFETALRTAWQPHLEGRVGFEAAVASLVAAATRSGD